MYSIEYNFTINDTVWVINNNDVLECIVTQITLEADPTSSGSIKEISTYHIHPISTKFDILLKSPEELFPSLSEIMRYISNKTPPTNPAPTIIWYNFTINEIVWTINEDIPIMCRVIQITFDIDPTDNLNESVRTIYHVLPPPDIYSVLLREELIVFHTKQDAIDYIVSKKLETISPTPTPSIPPTPTPTPTMSGFDNLILDENDGWILDETGLPVLEE